MLNHSLAGRLRPFALVVVLAAAVAPFAGIAPARAEAPFRLDAQITDRVGALGDRTGEAQAAVDKLRADTGLQLFVVFVASFDGLSAQQWAEQTAARSSLGTGDALLAVATQDRAYAYNVDSSSKLSNEELDDVAARDIEPALAKGDWAGAVIGAANGYADELGGGGPGGLVVFGVVCLVVVLVAAGVGIWFAVRARRRTAAAPSFSGPSTQELTDRANAQLLELDDALRASERDLSMATDQYGAEATAPFTAALESARAEVGEAFRLRMLLESPDAPDGAPHDETGRRDLLSQIIAHCEAADATLDDQADAFHELRELESRVESVSAELAARRDRAQARGPEAEATLSALRARYTPAALSAVTANPEQAAERVAFATSALESAATELTAGDRAQAAVAVQAAEQALDQAETLLDALTRTGTDLDAARASVDSLLAEVGADLAAARSASGVPAEVAGAVAAAVSGAERAEAAARAALAASTMDPLAVTRQLQEADAALDQALADVRDAQERTTRARAMLDQAIAAARAEIAAASDYVTTRRGAVLQQARTLLAEAQRHLSLAESLAATDPVTALAEARQADSLAEQASRAARSDVDSWTGGGGFAGPRGAADAGLGGLAGAVLGGILIGGTRRGGGYGGGFGGGGFGGGGFGGGGFGGGSFGGGFGGSGRRGGGGGFSGGGRRGGGGRF